MQCSRILRSIVIWSESFRNLDEPSTSRGVLVVAVVVVVVVVVLPIVVVVLLPFPPFSHPVLSLFSFFFLSARLARPEHPTPTVIRTQPHLGKIADSNTTTPPHLGASPTCTIPRVPLQLYQLLCRLG